MSFEPTADTMRERANESRLKLWLLLGANRLIVTGLLVLFIFLGYLALSVLYGTPLSAAIGTGDTIETMFSTMISGIITGTTLVVTISQLVIAQETGPLGDQHRRMSDALDFRDYTEEFTGTTTPADPSAFLKTILDTTTERAYAFRDAVSDTPDSKLTADVETFTDSLIENAKTVSEQLDGAQFGTFDVLFASLNYNYSKKLFEVDRLENEYADSLSDSAAETLTELDTALAMFGPVREHIKTLYFQWELMNLSRLILYAAVPTLVLSGFMLSFVGPSSFPGYFLGIERLLWVVGITFTITLTPFLLLVAYLLRIATVAQRTLAIGPLILRSSER